MLRIVGFRRLWIALSLSSLGDWLGLLATTAMATELVHGYSAQSYALGGVLFVRLLPALLLGPFAGALADRLNRRKTMVVFDVARFVVYASIPLVGTLAWLIGASFLAEAFSLFWIPAKEASVPNLVPPERLESANQLSLLTTYGTAPLASVVFALVALINSALATGLPFFRTNSVDLALYFDAGTFLFSAATVLRLREIGAARRSGQATMVGEPGVLQSIREGWQFVGRQRWVRGIVIGMLGAFAAGGTVVALGRLFALDLRAGNAGYGVLFGTLFLGLASGMFLGPRSLPGFSRRRLLGVAIVCAGLALAADAVSPNFPVAVPLSFLVGVFAGLAWVVGYTLVGRGVADELRGRTFSFLYTLMRVDLLVVLATAPFVAGAIGRHRLHLAGRVSLRLDGTTLTLLVAGLLGAAVGVVCYRMTDDRIGRPLWRDLWSSLRRNPDGEPARSLTRGLLIAVEGGEGAGKSTQVRLLAEALRAEGHEVVETREPGGTGLGRSLRTLLLEPGGAPPSPRAEALLYAADRADHVAREIRPALARGTVVITDRYVDSSVAYQGAGRLLPAAEVAALSRWATDGLVPDLTVLLDVEPAVGLARGGPDRDRIEQESLEFHRRVRAGFLALAAQAPDRYLVLDAAAPPAAIAAQVHAAVDRLLPVAPDRVAEGAV